MTRLPSVTFVLVAIAALTLVLTITVNAGATVASGEDERLLAEAKQHILDTLSARSLWSDAQRDPEKWALFFAAIHLTGRLKLTEGIPTLEVIHDELCRPANAEKAAFGQKVWLEVVPALARIGQESRVQQIAEYMRAERGFHRIVAARRALDFSVQDAIPILRQGIQSHRSLEEVLYSVEALSAVEDDYARGYLEAGMRQPSLEVRVQCATTAARYGLGFGESDLRHAFTAARGDVQFKAAEGLAWLGDPAAIDYLKRQVGGSDLFDWHVGIGILGDTCAASAVAPLRETASNTSVPLETRTYAVRALGNIGDARSLSLLSELAGGGEDLLRIASCAAIVQVLEGVFIPMESAYLRFDLDMMGRARR